MKLLEGDAIFVRLTVRFNSFSSILHQSGHALDNPFGRISHNFTQTHLKVKKKKSLLLGLVVKEEKEGAGQNLFEFSYVLARTVLSIVVMVLQAVEICTCPMAFV